MAPITNLFSRVAFPRDQVNLPLVVVMHGFSGAVGSLFDDSLARMARYGLFVAAAEMRGRTGVSGTKDCSGREIYDIYDALLALRTAYGAIIDPDYASIVGYSGGGGNAFAAAAKAPDAWAMVVSFFGMSDYGRNNFDGWYYNGGDTAVLQTQVGGTPGAVPDNYWSRDATYALGTNYSGGHVHLFHDDGDGAVPIIHSQRAVASMTAAGRSNYTTHYTTTTDSPRWLHGYPNVGDGGANTILAEPIWAAAAAARTYLHWTVPVAGSVQVIGYIKTKRFSIWLGAGVSEVADVAYDTAIDQYTVTPQTGSMGVVIVQGAKSASQTINSPTVITVT